MSVQARIRTHRATVRYLGCAAVSVALLSLTNSDTVQALRAVADFFLAASSLPAHRMVAYPADVAGRLIAAAYAVEENERLRDMVRRMYIYKIRAEQMEQDERRRCEVLGIRPPNRGRMLNARILRREPYQWLNSFVIARGSRDGVVLDAPVLTNSSVESFHLIGRIWTVESETARVLMITDPLSGIPVRIHDKRAEGVLLGNGTLYPTIEYLLPESDVAPGDRVVTAPTADGMTGNLDIGSIVSVEHSPKTGFKSARVALAGNISTMGDVLVLTP